MPEGNVAERPAQEEQGGGKSMAYKILQGVAIYYGMNMVMKQFMPKPQTTTEVKDSEGHVVKMRPNQLDEGAVHSPLPERVAPIWSTDSSLDVVVALSDSYVPIPMPKIPEQYLVLSEKEFKLGNYSDKRVVETTFDVPVAVQNNGTLWGHFYFGLTGSILDPHQQGFDPATAIHFAFPLTQYVPKKKAAKTRNLLEAKEEPVEEVEEDTAAGPTIASYYHPNASLSFIPDSGIINFPQSSVAVRQFLNLEPTGARDGTGQNGWYYPILFLNSFWQLKSHMTVLNETVKTLPIRIDLDNMRNWKFNLMASVELNAREQARQAAFGTPLPGGADGSEIEMIKEIFLDTNPWLLGITGVVSIFHMILEMLAFGSDIAHYRKKKDNVGISVRSILANVFMQAVIFLYLVDNSQNTSWMILGSQGIGILIEFWKITTVVNVRVRPAAPGSWFPYVINFEDKHKLSETEEKTKEYDEIAFKYMYMAGVPLLIAYAIYSLYYDTHKSWYSYIITSLVGSVYAYGFLMMIPSLYINYRLKSVAHMPGKAMMYKFLNTFIDDLFAFTIKMPFLHRMATFRDDIIFFIYIYQRWAYKIDYTRVNEFGQGGDDEEEEEAKKAEVKSLPNLNAAAELVGGDAKATGANVGKATKRK
ncbi:Cleft lip and palate transmembrane protein 1-like protein [Apiospora saccharicola]|uniref:Cleft lip and palate transmembrane protein 1-like protein n=1 Tax=Apiospora saccharicola TaxID=335842 RepID=A0ABR1TND8_9PEZI